MLLERVTNRIVSVSMWSAAFKPGTRGTVGFVFSSQDIVLFNTVLILSKETIWHSAEKNITCRAWFSALQKRVVKYRQYIAFETGRFLQTRELSDERKRNCPKIRRNWPISVGHRFCGDDYYQYSRSFRNSFLIISNLKKNCIFPSSEILKWLLKAPLGFPVSVVTKGTTRSSSPSGY